MKPSFCFKQLFLSLFCLFFFISSYSCPCEEHSADESEDVVAVKPCETPDCKAKEAKEVFEKSKILYTERELSRAMDGLASDVTAKLKDKNPIFVSVLVGGMVTTTELLKRLNFPLEVTYIHATRYKGELVGSELHWVARPTIPLEGRVVVLVDDIFDKGVTMTELVKFVKQAKAKEVYTLAFVTRDSDEGLAEGSIENVDFSALSLKNDLYIFGYGMDYKSYYRNIPTIRAVV